MKKRQRYVAYHLSMTARDYSWAIEDGRRFESITGDALATQEEVRAAMRADKMVVSYEGGGR